MLFCAIDIFIDTVSKALIKHLFFGYLIASTAICTAKKSQQKKAAAAAAAKRPRNYLTIASIGNTAIVYAVPHYPDYQFNQVHKLWL